MFVRWKRRPVGLNRRYGGEPYNAQRLSAVLVENRRVDGKPRQKIVKYLGTIRESYICPETIANEYVRNWARWARPRFWASVDAALASLTLDPADAVAIVSKIAARVPRVTAEEQAELDAAAARARLQVAALGIKI